jgi:hypothetical protein
MAGKHTNDKSGFGPRVMMHIRFGFAAGCEAVAVPRRQRRDLCPGYALGSGLFGQLVTGDRRAQSKLKVRYGTDG